MYKVELKYTNCTKVYKLALKFFGFQKIREKIERKNGMKEI